MSGAFRLEALSAAARVVAAYDAATDDFSFAATGRFWPAIARAHRLGFRGGGRKVAIIDTPCDLGLARLGSRIDIGAGAAAAAGDRLSHGTAVALLISRIAPDCRLDLYPMLAPDGSPDIELARQGIAAAARSDAAVINLSVGMERDVALHRHMADNPDVAGMLADPHRWLARVAPDAADCRLCPATAEAIARGKLVFAAAGNNPAVVCCPARAEGVVAVGFQHESRQVVTHLDGSLLENASASGTAYQSVLWDVAVEEIDGVLGTSFACPLYAGVGALGITAAELQGYLASSRIGPLAMALHAELRAGQGKAETVGQARAFYDAALSRLPHVHSAVEARLRPGIAPTDPADCWTCGIFAEDKYVNAGLFCLETGRSEDAASLLAVAGTVAPWSADAAANLGRTYEVLGRLAEALACYDRALALRPGFAVYARQRDGIRQRLPGGPAGP